MLYVSIANAAFWVLSLVNSRIMYYLAFDPYLVLHGEVWRIVTFALCPPSTGILAILVFYFYYWIDNALEQQWGTGQFTIYFFTGVVLTVLYGFLIYFLLGMPISLDSTYIYLSMFFSFAVLFPDMQVLFMFLIPMKMKYLALVDLAFFLYAVFTTQFPMNLLPLIALLNFLIFCGSELRNIMPRRKSRSTVNFKRESARIRREQEHKLYTHKCAVCGKTDVDYPELEFRYCSRCAGYHCFCSEHINNHIHFTE